MIFTAKRMLSTANKKKGSTKDASNVMDALLKEMIKDALFDNRRKKSCRARRECAVVLVSFLCPDCKKSILYHLLIESILSGHFVRISESACHSHVRLISVKASIQPEYRVSGRTAYIHLHNIHCPVRSARLIL